MAGEKPAAAAAKKLATPRKTAPKKKKAAPKRKAEGGEVNVYSIAGKVLGTVDLPRVFHAPLRPDLIRRAVTAAQANRRQPYGAMFNAGRRHSVRWSGKGQGVSRVPRIRGTMIGAQAPGTVGGAKAHPPRADRIWAKKMNDTERLKARGAALAALRDPALVRARGHRFEEKVTLPLVVEDKALEVLQELQTRLERGELKEDEVHPTKVALNLLTSLGVAADVERAHVGTHIRAGHGKMRSRKYREPRGPLLVLAKPDGAKPFANLSGVEVRLVTQLNTECLAPGGQPGRLTIFSEGALAALRGW